LNEKLFFSIEEGLFLPMKVHRIIRL